MSITVNSPFREATLQSAFWWLKWAADLSASLSAVVYRVETVRISSVSAEEFTVRHLAQGGHVMTASITMSGKPASAATPAYQEAGTAAGNRGSGHLYFGSRNCKPAPLKSCPKTNLLGNQILKWRQSLLKDRLWNSKPVTSSIPTLIAFPALSCPRKTLCLAILWNSRTWWCTSVIPAVGRLRWKFIGYLVSSRPSWVTC